MKIFRLSATIALSEILAEEISRSFKLEVESEIGRDATASGPDPRPLKTWVASDFRLTIHLVANDVAFIHKVDCKNFKAGSVRQGSVKLSINLAAMTDRPDEELVKKITSMTVTIRVEVTASKCRIPQPLQPVTKHELLTSVLDVMVDDERQDKKTQNAFRLVPQFRYICQPGDHSGDSWHVAAAMLLDSHLKVVATTKADEALFDEQPWIEVEDFRHSTNLVGCDLIELHIASSAGKQTLKLPGLETWEERMWGPYTGDTEFLVVANGTVHKDVQGGLIPLIVEQYQLVGTVVVDAFLMSGIKTVDVLLTPVAVRKKSFFASDFPDFEKLEDPGWKATVRLFCRQWTAELEVTPEGTNSKFNNKLNQFCRFYGSIGIAPERILIDRNLHKKGQTKWGESFNVAAASVEKDAGGDDPPYGMTWCSTSIIMGAVERHGVAPVQELLRRGFCVGLSQTAEQSIRKLLRPLNNDNRYLFVNMRYASHNAEHNTTKTIYKLICDAAVHHGLTIVRVGIPDPKSQMSGSGWMADLKELAIDIYGVEKRGRAPIEVDQRRTAFFWRCVADMKNVVGVIGGRSGSLDAAAFMGVRTFSWDITTRAENVEQTEYARLWIAYPFMSIGDRSSELEEGIEPEPLKLWLRGFHVIPQADPQPLPLTPALPLSKYGTKTKKGVSFSANLRLLMHPLKYINNVEGQLAWPRATFVSRPIWRRYSIRTVAGDSNCFFHVCADALGGTMTQVRRALSRYLIEAVFQADAETVTTVVLESPGDIGGLERKNTNLARELLERYERTKKASNDFPATFAGFAVFTQFTRSKVEELRKGELPGRPEKSIWGDDTTMLYAAAQCFERTMRVFKKTDEGLYRINVIANGEKKIDLIYADLHFDGIEFHVDPSTFVIVIQ